MLLHGLGFCCGPGRPKGGPFRLVVEECSAVSRAAPVQLEEALVQSAVDAKQVQLLQCF